MKHKQQLELALVKAAKYFEKRSLDEWSFEVNHALQQLEKSDYSFVESLWLKYAPTCEIDDLIIIDYSQEDEDLANQLNDELAEVANEAFSALDKFKNNQ